MQRTKRTLTVITILVLVLFLAAGCASQTTVATTTQVATTQVATTQATTTADPKIEYLNYDSLVPIVKDGQSVTIKFAVGQVAGYLTKTEDLWFWKYLEEFLNIKADVEVIQPEAASEKKNLMFASGDLPDILMQVGISTSDIVTYGINEAYLLSFDDYINTDYMPSLTADIAKNPSIKDLCIAPDGKMYAVPSVGNTDNTGGMQRLYVNQTWLDALGLKSPTTLDEFMTLMQTFKNTDAATLGAKKVIAMGGNFATYSPLTPFLQAMGFVTGVSRTTSAASSGFSIALRNGEVTIPCYDELYGEYLKLCKTCFDEGLIAKDFFTKDLAQTNAEMDEGNFGYVACPVYAYSSNKDLWKQYVAVKPLTSEWNSTPVTLADNPYSYSQLFVSANSEYKEVCCRFIDLFFSEYAFFLNSGPLTGTEEALGYSFKQYDAATSTIIMTPGLEGNEYTYRMTHILPTYTSFGDSSNTMTIEFGKLFGYTVILPTTLEEKIKAYTGQPSNEATICTEIAPYRVAGYPSITYRSAEDSQTMTDLMTVLQNYVIEQFAMFVTGERSIDTVDIFQKELTAMGMDKYLAFHQQEYADYLAQKSQ